MESLTVGELAARAGVATSALRFYEQRGLLTSLRSPGGQRRYPRESLRRVAFIRAAQTAGLGLDEIREALQGLPEGRVPTRADWQALAGAWQTRIEQRIAALERLRDTLSDCIGCGCLSLKSCALYNPEDVAGKRGPGARYWLGERPSAPADADAP